MNELLVSSLIHTVQFVFDKTTNVAKGDVVRTNKANANMNK